MNRRQNMTPLNLNDVRSYIATNIATFHTKRLEGLKTLKLSNVLKRKNPYLFRVKYMLTAEQIVKGLVDAHISSNEETIFGDWLEGLVIFISGRVCGGRKSGIPGIDLEFDIEGLRYIVTVKSGPNWGNSSQIAKIRTDFTLAKKTLRTSNSRMNIVAVNGCCYGRENHPDKGDYFKYCGQLFWRFISNDDELFTNIIAPLGYQAKERNDDFMTSYTKMINAFTREFANAFCTPDGAIDWERLVRFNSEASRPAT